MTTADVVPLVLIALMPFAFGVGWAAGLWLAHWWVERRRPKLPFPGRHLIHTGTCDWTDLVIGKDLKP